MQNFYVDPDTYLVQKEWLLTGWALNQWMSEQSGTKYRDFLVPKPTPDLEGFRKGMVKYAEALAMSRAVFAKLKLETRMPGADSLAGAPSNYRLQDRAFRERRHGHLEHRYSPR